LGALQSKLFTGDSRLEACAVLDAAHVTLGTVGDFVTKIQTALQLIDGASIDAADLTSNRYGASTARAVLAFKTKRSIINPVYQQQPDDIVGKMTIARLDAEMVVVERRSVPPPPVPPGPTPPRSLTFEEAKRAIERYLQREARTNVAEILDRHAANLLAFGEVHFAGDPMKAFLFAELTGRARLRRPINTHFHASERFPNDQFTRKKISDVLQSSPSRIEQPIARLSGRVRPFMPVLASANTFPGRRFGVLPSDASPGASEDTRHQAIFAAFNDAARQCPDVPSLSINSATSRGTILLGARHAARKSVLGHAAITTAERLIGAGWRLHVIRLTVPLDVTTVPEDLDLQLIGSTDNRVIDGLSIVNSIGTRNYYADLTKPDSPFAKLKLKESGGNDIPVNQLFDAIVHLGGPASL
jgi:hypothetical protein